MTKKGDGAKNARTFLIGAIIYIALFMFLMHHGLKNKFTNPILKTGFFLILVVDMATMAYLYRSYYGRLITNEILSTDDEESKWKYSETNHKYKLKTEDDIQLEEEINKVKNDYNYKELEKLRTEMNGTDDEEYHFDNDNDEVNGMDNPHCDNEVNGMDNPHCDNEVNGMDNNTGVEA
jgi:hypothetical protein